MDSFEWNKIAGAVLFALLLTFGLGIFSNIIFESEAPEPPGYVIAVATEEGAPGGGEKPAAQPIAVLLASADAKKGEASAKKCGVCHDFTQGGPNKVGPNLYGVVNRPIASHDGYEYDDAMKKFAQEANTWTFEHLNTFLHDPKGTVPGTKMAFAGLPNDSERANVIAYLRTLSDNPAPLPEPPTDAAAAGTTTETQVASAAPEAPAAPAAGAPAATTEAPAAPMASAPATEAPAATAEAPAPAEAAPAQAAPAPSEQAAAPAQAPMATEAPAAQQQTAQTETPAAAPAAPCRRRPGERRSLRQALLGLSRPHRRRGEQGRTASLRRGRSADRLGFRLPLLRRDDEFFSRRLEGVGRGDARHLPGRPAQGGPGNKDGLPRYPVRAGPGKRHRLPGNA